MAVKRIYFNLVEIVYYGVLKPYVLKTKALCIKKYSPFFRNNTSIHVIPEINAICLDYYYLK